MRPSLYILKIEILIDFSTQNTERVLVQPCRARAVWDWACRVISKVYEIAEALQCARMVEEASICNLCDKLLFFYWFFKPLKPVSAFLYERVFILFFPPRNTDRHFSKAAGCGCWLLPYVQCGGWEPKLVLGWEHCIILHWSRICRQRRWGIPREQQNAWWVNSVKLPPLPRCSGWVSALISWNVLSAVVCQAVGREEKGYRKLWDQVIGKLSQTAAAPGNRKYFVLFFGLSESLSCLEILKNGLCYEMSCRAKLSRRRRGRLVPPSNMSAVTCG